MGDFDYNSINFLASKNVYNEIEKKNNICTNEFGYESDLVCLIYISGEKCKDHMDLLLIKDGNNVFYYYIKDLNSFIFNKQSIRERSTFAGIARNVLMDS